MQRRDFIKVVGGAGLGSALVSSRVMGREAPHGSLDPWRDRYLSIAKDIAASVERTGVDPETGMYLSFVNTETGSPMSPSRTHHANWYLPGLWMLYWRTGDATYLEWIARHGGGLWNSCVDPGTGMPWMWYDIGKGGQAGRGAGHRIQYQVAALGNWDSYLRSLRSGVKYQIVSDGRGKRTVIDHIDPRRPGDPKGMYSPDYFGCLDLRIPTPPGPSSATPNYTT